MVKGLIDRDFPDNIKFYPFRQSRNASAGRRKQVRPPSLMEERRDFSVCTIYYQLAFFTPGMRPAEAISRNWIREMPNWRI